MAKRAIFQGPVEIGETPVYAEGTSAVALVPGYVVTRSGGTLALLNAAATNATEALVVVERGSGFKGDITTPWTIGDTVRAVKVRSGQFVNVACKTAQTLANGDFLTSRLPLAVCWRKVLPVRMFRCSSWKRLLPPLPLVSSFWLIRHKEKLCP